MAAYADKLVDLKIRMKKQLMNLKGSMNQLAKKYKDIYEFLDPYVSFLFPVRIKCKRCGSIRSVTTKYTYSRDNIKCPNCDKFIGKSYKATDCIDKISKTTRLKFDREYSVYPYKLDGYNKRYNIVIEFNGDCWHGNPKVYSKRQKPNIYSNLTASK